ncbi:hypothetical protein B0H11DRAFT_2189146 [Mycena galericulata]|nr:hypothetical protein B0H11DRAFT_2189146 [Mycena galericulata]
MSTASLDFATVAQDQRLRRSVFLSGLVVILYDHLLTLGSEIKHIWVRPVKRSSAWFLTFRYLALLSNLSMTVFFLGDFSPESLRRSSLDVMHPTTPYASLFALIVMPDTLALRVCAMYGFNRRVLVSLGIAVVTTVSLGIWAVLGPDVTLETTLPGCFVTTSRPKAIRFAVAWEALLACDILILCLTLRHAVTYHRTVGLISGSLFPIMVRDGASYFGVLCVVNVANIVMLYSGDIITADSLVWFASAISVTMISRLMLNLHDAANGSFSLTSTAQYNRPEHDLGPIRFRTSGSRRLEGDETQCMSSIVVYVSHFLVSNIQVDQNCVLPIRPCSESSPKYLSEKLAKYFRAESRPRRNKCNWKGNRKRLLCIMSVYNRYKSN